MKIPHRILYFIQMPPPVHGVSTINSQVYSSILINEDFEKVLLEIKFSDRIDELRRFTIKKMGYFFKLSVKLIYTLIVKSPDSVYFSFMPVGKGFYRDLLFVLIIKTFRKNLIFHLHNRGIAKTSQKYLHRFLYKVVFNNSAIIHLSKRLIDEEFSQLNLKNVKFYVVANGLSFQSMKPSKLAGDNIRLLFLSNLLMEKGIYVLLKAFESICKKHSNIYLSIVGAPFKANDYLLNSSLSMNPINNKVVCHGPLYGNDKYQILADSDIFIFPSYFEEECFPLVILEAMAAGLPVIASKVGVIDEIIDEDISGYLVPPGDDIALASKLEKLITDKKKMLSMGLKGRKKYIEKYSHDVFEKTMNQTLKEIIKIDTL